MVPPSYVCGFINPMNTIVISAIKTIGLMGLMFTNLAIPNWGTTASREEHNEEHEKRCRLSCPAAQVFICKRPPCQMDRQVERWLLDGPHSMLG